MTETKYAMVGIETFNCEICGEETSVFKRYKNQQTDGYICETHAMPENVEDMSDEPVSNENQFGTDLARKFA